MKKYIDEMRNALSALAELITRPETYEGPAVFLSMLGIIGNVFCQALIIYLLGGVDNYPGIVFAGWLAVTILMYITWFYGTVFNISKKGYVFYFIMAAVVSGGGIVLYIAALLCVLAVTLAMFIVSLPGLLFRSKKVKTHDYGRL